MKKLSALLCAFLLLCACARTERPAQVSASVPATVPTTEPVSAHVPPENRTVRVGMTQMLADTGLMYLLRSAFESQSDYRLEFAPSADATAVAVAQTGAVDLLLVQQGIAAERFLSVGYGTQSVPWLRGSLVLAGPADDPADVRTARSAAEAMARIAQTGCTFVSRYDDSDLCIAEDRLWSAAGVSVSGGRRWYKQARMEMAGSLRMADTEGAYILSEKETFLQNRDALSLEILLDGTEDMYIQYCIIPVSADTSARVNASGAAALADWLQSEEAMQLLTSYGTDSYGCPIFEPDKMEESQ